VRDKLPAGGTVGVLGLAYKPETNVVEQSAGLLLVTELAADGIDVVAFDPAGMHDAARAVGDGARFAESADECVRAADVVVVVTPWPEFAVIDPALLGGRTVVDCWRLLPPESAAAASHYVAVGRAAEPRAASAVQPALPR
jgi:UDPglucose 6-dehydrogenase